MWKQPYSFKEGTAIAIGLMLTGAMLQVSMGPVDWDIFMWPANIIALAVFVAVLVALYLLRQYCYFLRFMTTVQAAVPAIAAALTLTLIMGLTRQVAQVNPPADPLGFTKMLESWPFILVYIWMTAIVGEVAIKQAASLKSHASAIPSLLSHIGLFVALTCGTLGSADMQRLKMYCEQGKPEWRGLDAWSNVHELPVAIELRQFTIDEYPPKLMVIDKDGRPLPYGKPEVLSIDTSFHKGQILGWDVTVEKRIDNAMPAALSEMTAAMPQQMQDMIRMDSPGLSSGKVGYVPTKAAGSECALLVSAVKPGGKTVSGWTTCGSYRFRYEGLPLDSGHALVMASREPQRFASAVDVYTKDGKRIDAEIEVNHPLNVNGWKVYQLSYDERMGKWSTLSVFELVRDPWLPAVYTGILLIALGAGGMFFRKPSDRSRLKHSKPQS